MVTSPLWALSCSVLLGLTLQAIAIVLVVVRLRGRVATHLGAIFILLAVTYHGLGEILIMLIPGRDFVRALLVPAEINSWMMVISPAILLLTVAYLIALGHPTVVPNEPSVQAEREHTARFFEWRLMLAIALPLAVLGLRAGQVGGTQTNVQGLQVTTGLSAGLPVGLVTQFYPLALVIASFSIVSRFGKRALLPTLALQSALLLREDSRLDIVIAAVMLLFLLLRYGIRYTRKQIVIFAAVIIIAVVDISAARSPTGASDANGTAASLKRDLAAFGHLFGANTRTEIAYTLGYHLDGNSFGALEFAAIRNGAPPLGLAPVRDDILVAVPSFLSPDKLNTSIEARVEKDLAVRQFAIIGLSNGDGSYRDFLPSELGSFVGYYGQGGLFFFAATMGITLGLADRFLRSHYGPKALAFSVGLAYLVLNYQSDRLIWFTTLRGVLVIVATVWAVQVAKALMLPPQTMPFPEPTPTRPMAHPALSTHAKRAAGDVECHPSLAWAWEHPS